MFYINALHLINVCIDNNILKEKDKKVLVYRSGTPTSAEGWYLVDKDILAKELMNDKDGQDVLIEALKEKNVEFVPVYKSEMEDGEWND
jgi:hypothetical protein